MLPKYSATTRSNKCSLVRFDLNDYSIPWDYTRDAINVEADDLTVIFFHNGNEIARHERSWGRDRRITKAEHWQEKPSQSNYNFDELVDRFPVLDDFYRQLMDRGEKLSQIKQKISDIYKLHGEERFQVALRICRRQQMFHPTQISRVIIGLEKADSNTKTSFNLKHRKDLEHLDIRSHDLGQYDNIF